MVSSNSNENFLPEAATHHSRREALKRFGRYAAAAPTVVMLLQPSEGHARQGNGRGWGKGGKAGKGGRGKGGTWAKRGDDHY